MLLQEIWNYMEKEIFTIPSTPLLFNPYNSPKDELSIQKGDEIRKENLRKYLECFKKKPSYLVVAEAPGPWGCRFSGVPLTTEEQLCLDKFPFEGKQSSKGGGPQPRGDSRRGPTAKTFWKVMKPFHPTFLAWDAIPFHPHDEGQLLSIRRPKTGELKDPATAGLLRTVHSVLKPVTVVAVGRKAEHALKYINVPQESIKPVWHPARRTREFTEGIKRIFENQARR
jgi:hypothetical protein